jgi:hypothetical protein
MATQSRQKPERSNAGVVGTVLLWIVLALLQGCRRIGDFPSNFKPDFEFNITPDTVSVSSGATTSNVALATISDANHFPENVPAAIPTMEPPGTNRGEAYLLKR